MQNVKPTKWNSENEKSEQSKSEQRRGKENKLNSDTSTQREYEKRQT